MDFVIFGQSSDRCVPPLPGFVVKLKEATGFGCSFIFTDMKVVSIFSSNF